MVMAARPLVDMLYDPGALVTEFGALQKFSSYVSERPPLPLVVSSPTTALGTPDKLPHCECPVKEVTKLPFSEALVNPPAGTCCCTTTPFSNGVAVVT